MNRSIKMLRAGANKWIKRAAGLKHASLVRRAWTMSGGDIAEYQQKILLQNYVYAREHVPYYREHPALYPPIDPGLPVASFLARLPVLEKKVVREHMEAFYAQPRPALTSFHTTSGTSGSPLRLAATLWERGFGTAIYDQWEARVAGRLFPRTLFLSGFLTPESGSRDLYWRDPVSGNVFLSIYALNAAHRAEIASLINRMRPQLIFGYASTVHNLAQVLGDSVADSSDSRVSIVTSEVLNPAWREEIQTNLCRRVYDMYGSQEGCHLALECDQGRLHLHPLVGILEIVDEAGQPVPAGQAGQGLVTGLVRRTMPLFRYRLGDTIESTGFSTGCPCGLSWPTIGAVSGRSEDLVITRDGRRVGYLCFHSTKNLSGISESQLVQVDFERFVFNIVLADTAADRPSLEAKIQEQLRNRLQTPVSVEFRYLAGIPRGARGKFKSVVVDFSGGEA